MDTIPTTVDELKACLAELPPLPRARLLGLLVDAATVAELGALRREAVWELTREATHAAVAAELGVASTSVTKAVSEHRKAAGLAVIKGAGVSVAEATAGVPALGEALRRGDAPS